MNPQQRYIDYALEWGNKHEWGLRNSADGWKTRNVQDKLISFYMNLIPRNLSITLLT